MHCYPDSIEEKLGFDKIKEQISNNCLSPLGQELCQNIQFSTDAEHIKLRLETTQEFITILKNSEDFPSNHYKDMREVLQKIEIPGTYLLEEELAALFLSQQTIAKIVHFFAKREHYKRNFTTASRVSIDHDLLQEIANILDEKNQIKDNASAELFNIRTQIKQQRQVVLKKINQALKQSKKESWSSADASVSVRNGRYVIPVNSFNKRQLGGVVVDESASGQTAFVEPAEVVEINNQIRHLLNLEKKEIVKILLSITNQVRENLVHTLRSYKYLASIDIYRAKAKFALKVNACVPKIKTKRTIKWKQAVHPLLYLSFKEKNKTVVPLNIELSDKHNRLLLISGPNAGGKSICMQTVALLQYMFQSGVPVSVGEDSEFGIFSNMLLDLGDEQSIENDLSTYSSHLLNIKNFFKLSTKNSLIFIDEFGTGTEPKLGGAIAEAVLETLNERQVMGVITTHYGNLKQFATKTNGIVNGAMLYDTQHLAPTFKLAIGKAGSSFAFEAARKIGLNEKILKLAEQKIGKEELDFDKNLRAISRDKLYLEKKREEVKRAERKYQRLVEEYELKIQNIKKEQREILSKAKEDAQQVLGSANKLIENTVSSIKKSQAEKNKTKQLREKLEVSKENLINRIANQEKKVQPKKQKSLPSNIHKKNYEIGDKVRIKGQAALGEITQLKGKKASIVYGNFTTSIDLNRLEHISEKEYKQRVHKKTGTSSVGESLLKIKQAFSTQLDVRGKRAEEAITLVSEHIDRAIVCQENEIKILHGTGTGALKMSIREFLRSLPHVSNFKDEDIKLGGSGITVVSI